MFIIFGSPRSGTTILATTISLHSKLMVLDQTDFIVPWALLMERVTDTGVRCKLMTEFALHTRYWASSVGMYLGAREIQKIVDHGQGDFVGTLQALYKYIGSTLDKSLVGDKSVSDISYFPVLNRTGLLDGALKIIHIVRDVRDVMSSLERLNWIKDRRIFPRSWNHSNIGLHDLLADKPYYYFLRYEDFVELPGQRLLDLFSFLEVEHEDVLSLSPKLRGREYMGLNYHRNLQNEITNSRVGCWMQELSLPLVHECEKQANEGLQRFGYTKKVLNYE